MLLCVIFHLCNVCICQKKSIWWAYISLSPNNTTIAGFFLLLLIFFTFVLHFLESLDRSVYIKGNLQTCFLSSNLVPLKTLFPRLPHSFTISPCTYTYFNNILPVDQWIIADSWKRNHEKRDDLLHLSAGSQNSESCKMSCELIKLPWEFALARARPVMWPEGAAVDDAECRLGCVAEHKVYSLASVTLISTTCPINVGPFRWHLFSKGKYIGEYHKLVERYIDPN